MCSNALINLLGSSRVNFAIFTIYMTIGYNDPQYHKIVIQATLEFFIYAFEVFLLWFTTENIDFKIYIYNLMVGINQINKLGQISIFLIHVPGNSNQDLLIESANSINSVAFLEKSESEEVRKRLIDYDTRSNMSGHTISGFFTTRQFIASDTNNRLASNEASSMHKSQPIITFSDE